jgi:lysophospholipase L1-like esterase
LDYYSALVDERNGLNAVYADDGVHPNKAGYEVMAPIVENAIQSILK